MLIIATLAIHTGLSIMLILTYKSWVFFFATRYLNFRNALDLAIASQVIFVIRSLLSSLNLDILVAVSDLLICVVINILVFLLYFTVKSGIVTRSGKVR